MGRSSVMLAAALALAALLACKKSAPPTESTPTPVPAPQPPPTAASTEEKPAATAKSFTGSWDTAWGKVTLVQSGSAVTGDYSGQFKGKLAGDAEGNVATLTWTQTNGETGKAKFTLSADGESFAGTWGSGASASNGGVWNGKRKN